MIPAVPPSTVINVLSVIDRATTQLQTGIDYMLINQDHNIDILTDTWHGFKRGIRSLHESTLPFAP